MPVLRFGFRFEAHDPPNVPEALNRCPSAARSHPSWLARLARRSTGKAMDFMMRRPPSEPVETLWKGWGRRRNQARKTRLLETAPCFSPPLLSPIISCCTLFGMSSKACPTRKLLLNTVLDAIEKSAVAKQEYDSARPENVDSLALALRITKGAERAAVSVLDDHI
jgi:hypothetical protein